MFTLAWLIMEASKNDNGDANFGKRPKVSLKKSGLFSN